MPAGDQDRGWLGHEDLKPDEWLDAYVIPRLINGFKACGRILSLAHELSGLGSTRVVRFSASGWRRIDEPDDVATGPEDAEVSRRFEPVGAQGAISNGGWRAVGVLGTAVPALPAAL